MKSFLVMAAALALLSAATAPAQVTPSGRLLTPRFPGSTNSMPLTGILCFASLDGPGSEARPFRTWETEPVGRYRLTGSTGFLKPTASPANSVPPGP